MGRRTVPSAHPARSAGLPAVFRPRDLPLVGIPVGQLKTWIRRGEAERVGRGLYRLADAETNELESLALVAKRAPRAVFCLGTALLFHGIGTQAPPDVWIALPSKAARPRFRGLPVQVVWFSDRMLRYGVQDATVHGVPIRITSPARTVVDCFRYRNKIGLDVALEALTDVLRSRKVTVDELTRAAEVGRVRRVMQPYLQAVLS